MALSNFRIDVTRNSINRVHGIYDIEYAEKPIYQPKNDLSGKPINGRILPCGKPFPLNTALPCIDLKVVRAMLSSGHKAEAVEVLTTKHRSHVTPDAVWDGAMGFAHPTVSRVSDSYWTDSVNDLELQFDIERQLKPISMEEASLRIPQNTNPGFPFIDIDPGHNKGEIIDKYFDKIKEEWEEIVTQRNYLMPDCAAYARSATSTSDKSKVRLVWAYPITMILAEAMFALPLADEMKEQKCFKNSAFGMEMMCGGMQFLNNQAMHAKAIDPGCKFLMTDFTSFDASVPAWIIRDCFSIIRKKFDISSRPAYYANVLRRVEAYFINTPIRNADGRRFLKNHGIPSGTMFTNIIGTMCNFLISRYLIRSTTCKNPIFDVYFGDDALICLPGDATINMDNLAFQAKRALGVNLSADKSYWTNVIYNIHFLGYYNSMGSPYKTDLDLFTAMIFPQYATDDWSYSLARALGCVSASAGNSPAILSTARMILWRCQYKSGRAEKATGLITRNARMIRFFETMGIDPFTIGVNTIKNSTASIPSTLCTKLRYGIQLC